MTTALIVGAAVAVLACPVHMLWRMRRGGATCCVPARDDARALQARQRTLAGRLSQLSRAASKSDPFPN